MEGDCSLPEGDLSDEAQNGANLGQRQRGGCSCVQFCWVATVPLTLCLDRSGGASCDCLGGGDCGHGRRVRVEQTLQEMDFERSLCGAAAAGDAPRLTRLLASSGRQHVDASTSGEQRQQQLEFTLAS